MLRLFLVLALLPGTTPALPVRAQAAATEALEDGPYVLWRGRTAQVLRVRQGRLEETLHRVPFDLDLAGLAAAPLRLGLAPPAVPPSSFRLPPKLFAVSDVHGNLDGLQALLQAHKVMDPRHRWSFGRGHLVVVGDVFDRGPRVTEVLWLLRSLEAQASRAGGRVHLLLGNHEAMALQGDHRYLHPKYLRLLDGVLPARLAELYGPATELGRWLRTRPALLKIGPYLFVHGGISKEFLDLGLDLETANAALRRGLDAPRADATASLLSGEQGPLWHRGQVPGEGKGGDEPEQVLERALKFFRVRAIILGHTTRERIAVFHGGRVYAIDAGLKAQGGGEAWIFEGGKVLRGTADGRREAFGSP